MPVTDNESAPLTVGVGETVPQGDADGDAERVEEVVEQVDKDREALRLGVRLPEPQTDGDSDGVCVAVPQDEADWDILPLDERLLLAVEQMLGEADTETVVESEPHPVGDADIELLALLLA